jgi:hypothetical protein
LSCDAFADKENTTYVVYIQFTKNEKGMEWVKITIRKKSYTERRKKGGGKFNLERGEGGKALRDEASGDWRGLG